MLLKGVDWQSNMMSIAVLPEKDMSTLLLTKKYLGRRLTPSPDPSPITISKI